MALLKTHTLPNSTTASYWKITGLVVDLISKVANVSVTGYVDAQARQNNVNAGVLKKNFQVTLDSVDTNLIEQAYEKVKLAKENGQLTTVFFADATNS